MDLGTTVSVAMWKVYKYDGHYIQGELVGSHSSESAALKKAKKVIGHSRTEKEEDSKEVTIWLDDENGTPMGVIIKKKRAKKSPKK
jgi:hypothetical protein